MCIFLFFAVAIVLFLCFSTIIGELKIIINIVSGRTNKVYLPRAIANRFCVRPVDRHHVKRQRGLRYQCIANRYYRSVNPLKCRIFVSYTVRSLTTSNVSSLDVLINRFLVKNDCQHIGILIYLA